MDMNAGPVLLRRRASHSLRQLLLAMPDQAKSSIFDPAIAKLHRINCMYLGRKTLGVASLLLFFFDPASALTYRDFAVARA